MNVESYQKAKEIILTNEDRADFVGGCSDELIKLAEEKLNLKFTGLYLDFLQTFGAGNFGSQEIYGIIHADFENSSVPDAIWYSLTERNKTNLPQNLVVIYDTGSDELICLDFDNRNDHGEPKIVTFAPGFKLGNQTYELIADDFGDFLLDLVNQEI